ncbi:hypothetical protein AHAS_Ahas15G0384400 [Arachis hypogaea]
MFLVFIFILFLGFFFVGVVTVVVAEALGILWIIERAMKDKDKISAPVSLDTSSQNDPINHLTLPSKKRKREVLEVSPVKKHGKIKGESLIFTEHDGSETAIWLKGCVVEAVSSSSLPSKKWAKRYPIKVENNKSVVYHGSKLLYIYLETSWENEAWCKSLRMASRDQSEKLKWSSQLYEECHRNLASLNIEYHPFIMRPSAGSSFDALEKSSKPDGSSSRVPQFLSRITKKPTSFLCAVVMRLTLRVLTNVRTPTYFGEVICTDINMGTTPPSIVAMRVLPMEMNDVCTFEADIEYSGGAVVEIETRLEVGEPQNDKGTECSSNAGAAPSDLEDLSNQLNLGDGVNDSQEPNVVESIKVKDVNLSYADVSKVSRSTSSSFYGSKWKSMLNSLAKHVSQVPLTLAIRIVSLKGTMRLQLKPPPSDNLWYGFTLMPDIDFNLESCVRDHKITNARIALFLLNRLKENWIPRTVAPYMWVKQECGHDTSASNDSTRISVEAYIMQETEDLKELPASSIENENRDETREEKTEDITVYQPQTLYSLLMDKQVSPSEQKKIGKREKMFDLRKRMSEKLEEKRRHFVEKMRGP